MKKLLCGILIAISWFSSAVNAQSTELNRSLLKLEILSAQTMNGIAGDFVTVQAQIKNESKNSLPDITTYLSLVDNQNKLPVDLEDWSAEKGLFIGTIEAGQTLPLNWKIHFVKAGDYSLIIVAIINGQKTEVSGITHFNVKPKINLNPGQVLPIALGMPFIIIFLMFWLKYRRQKIVK